MDNRGRVACAERFETTGLAGTTSAVAERARDDECFAASFGAAELSARADVFLPGPAVGGDVFSAGRFLFSGMRPEMITSLGGCDQLDQNQHFHWRAETYRRLAAKNEDPTDTKEAF
jgi:hypothetical protein